MIYDYQIYNTASAGSLKKLAAYTEKAQEYLQVVSEALHVEEKEGKNWE